MTGDAGSSSNGFPLPLAEKGLTGVSSSDHSALFSILLALDGQTEQQLKERTSACYAGPTETIQHASCTKRKHKHQKVKNSQRYKKPKCVNIFCDSSWKHPPSSSSADHAYINATRRVSVTNHWHDWSLTWAASRGRHLITKERQTWTEDAVSHTTGLQSDLLVDLSRLHFAIIWYGFI